MKRSRKKPTGTIGPVVVPGGNQPFQPIAFPETKSEIEDMILGLAWAALQGTPACPWRSRPVRNVEDHFDFTIANTPPEYLDLMEVQPQKGPHSSAVVEYNHGAMADAVRADLTRKAVRYGESSGRRIHILLYSTHLAFRLSSGVIDILSFYLSHSDHGLSSVVYAVPDDPHSAEVVLVWPRPAEELQGFSLTAARAKRSLIGNFSQAESQGDTVVVPLGGSPANRK